MGKRKKVLMLMLLVVVGCSLTCIAWAQENDILDISSYSNSLKSEVSQDDTLENALINLDRSIDILNLVAELMGVLVGLLALILMVYIALGIFEYPKWKKILKETEQGTKEAKKSAEEAKKSAEDVKPIAEKFKDMEKNLIDNINQISLSSLKGISPEERKHKLNEFGNRIEILKIFGISLNFENYFIQANCFYFKGDFKSALEAFEKAINLKPDDAKAWYNKGVVLGELNRSDEALKAYDEAITIDPDYVEAWYNKGIVLGKLNRPDEELKAYDEAIKIDPDYVEAWFNKACVYSSQKNDKENALKNLSKAIELDQKYKEEAKKEEDFKNLWNDEDFKKIVS